MADYTKRRLFSDNDSNAGGGSVTGWTQVSQVISQADMRILNSGSGGFGYQIKAAAGVNKIYQLANIIFFLRKTAGTLVAGTYNIISDAADVDQLGYMYVDDEVDTVYTFIFDNPAANWGYNLNSALYLFSGSDSPTYEGTGLLIYDYREITLA